MDIYINYFVSGLATFFTIIIILVYIGITGFAGQLMFHPKERKLLPEKFWKMVWWFFVGSTMFNGFFALVILLLCGIGYIVQLVF